MFLNEVIAGIRSREEKKAILRVMQTTVTGLGVGLAVGAMIGLLFAPKKGSETRKAISDGVQKAVRNAEETAEVAMMVGEYLKAKAIDSYEEIKAKATGIGIAEKIDTKEKAAKV